MPPALKLSPADGLDTRTRIVRSAQRAFSEKGYSEARVQDVAEAAGVAPSLVIKYFGSKANLFREALSAGLEGTTFRQDLKASFGETLVEAVGDPHLDIFAPAMIALSLGDEEARRIAAEVIGEHIAGPVSEWLGGPDAEARAAAIVMVSTGFAIFARHMPIRLSEEARRLSSAWLARMLQDLIEASPPEPRTIGSAVSDN